MIGLDVDLAHRVAALERAAARRFALEMARDACARDAADARDWQPALAALAAGAPLPSDDPALHSHEPTGTVTYTAFAIGIGIGNEPALREPLAADVAARAAIVAAADADPVTAALRAVYAASWSVANLSTWLPRTRALTASP